MDDLAFDSLLLRFAVPPNDDPVFSESDKTVLAGLYLHQLSYRAQIEGTAPGSAERDGLIREMYAKSWALTAGADFYAEFAGRDGEIEDRTKEATALLRLSGAQRVLEVGVGQGALADAMGSLGCFVDGIDVAPGLQWETIQARHSGRVRLWTGSVQTVTESTYELCVLEGMLEHVPSGDYEMLLDSCYKALKPGGWLVVCIPNPLTGPHDSSRWFTGLGQPATGDHFNERTMKELRADFVRAGFRNLRTTLINSIRSGRRPIGWSRVWLWRALLLEQVCARVNPLKRAHPMFTYTIPRTLAGQKR